VIGAIGIAVSPVVLEIHAAVLTEPLFLALSFGSLGLLARFRVSRQRDVLIASAVLAALACLTRYSGAALVVAAMLLLATGAGTRRRRAIDSSLFFAIAAVPSALWLLRNVQAGGALTDRTFALHPIEIDRLRIAAEAMASWVWVGPFGVIGAGIAMAIGLGLWEGWRRGGARRLENRALARSLLVFVVVYLVFLAVSVSFLDAAIPPNDRILAPTWVALWVLALLGVDSWRRIRPDRWLSTALTVLCLSLLAAYTATTAQWAHTRAQEGGIGFGSVDWHQSPTIAAVRALAPHTLLYSNGPDALQLLTGRPARSVPRETDGVSLQTADDYSLRLAALRASMRAGSVLVWLDWISWRWYLPELSELRDQLPIRPAKTLGDGSIWIYDSERDVQQ